MVSNTYFISVYEIERHYLGNGMRSTHLIQVVGSKISAVAFEELGEYFSEIEGVEILRNPQNNNTTFTFLNAHEELEDSPMPDGVIVNARAFMMGYYAVVLGRRKQEGDCYTEDTIRISL